MKKFTFILKLSLFPVLLIFISAFSKIDPFVEGLSYLQKSFADHYDAEQESDHIKRYELNVTNNGFCRYKRFYLNGKTEYFAFNLTKLKDIDYLGSTEVGKLYLRTKGEDVIVQTSKDKNGDIDSMANEVAIPLKNIQPEDLNEIRENLRKVGVKL